MLIQGGFLPRNIRWFKMCYKDPRGLRPWCSALLPLCRPLASCANRPKGRMQKRNPSCACRQTDVRSTDSVLVWLVSSSPSVLPHPSRNTVNGINTVHSGSHSGSSRRGQVAWAPAAGPATPLPPAAGTALPVPPCFFTRGLGIPAQVVQAFLSRLQELNSVHCYFELTAYLIGKTVAIFTAHPFAIVEIIFIDEETSRTARQNPLGHLIPHPHFTNQN